ncbi:MAG TPA: DUF2721 domain-containing protein [Lacipirellulaceae bacterium]
MDANPFGILTFIVAPAILTNASSVNALATSNRLGRATDRARAISTLLETHKDDSDPWRVTYLEILSLAERRINFLVRAMTCFYAAIVSFASASLVSLFGAVFFVEQWQACGTVALGISLVAGVIGVGGLAYGSALLVRETRVTLQSVSKETQFLLQHHQTKSVN